MCNNCCGQCKFAEFSIRDNTKQVVGKFVKVIFFLILFYKKKTIFII